MDGRMKHFGSEGFNSSVSRFSRVSCRYINDEKTTIDSFPQKL